MKKKSRPRPAGIPPCRPRHSRSPWRQPRRPRPCGGGCAGRGWGRAPPPRPSGGGAGSSSRARTGRRSCRGRRRRPGFRRGAAGDVALDQHAVVAEGVDRLALGAVQLVVELGGVGHDAHALAAAAGRRLDQHGKADALRLGAQKLRRLVLAVVAGHQRHAGLLHQRLGFGLAAHGADRGGGRADEDDARVGAGFGESGVFRQEAVAGMDRLGARAFGGVQDGVRPQVAVAGGRRADVDGLVGHLDMQRLGVGVGIDRDRADAEPAGGADDAAGDLAAVGDQDLGEHGIYLASRPACAFQGTPPDLPVLRRRRGCWRSVRRCRG